MNLQKKICSAVVIPYKWTYTFKRFIKQLVSKTFLKGLYAHGWELFGNLDKEIYRQLMITREHGLCTLMHVTL